MSILALAIEVAKLAIMAIILYYVCEVLAMPQIPKVVCQLLIIFIAIIASIQLAMSRPSDMGRSPVTHQLVPTPSIIAPERR